MTRGESLRRVEAEIRQAKAEALGRAGERLDVVLRELAERDRCLDRILAAAGATAPGDLRLARELETRNRLRDEARRLLHHLIIQREAIGLVRHGLVFERYPIPSRRSFRTAGTTAT